MLESSLASENAEQTKQQHKGPSEKMPPTSHTLMDLIVTISIYLPRPSFATLFSLAAVVLDKQSSDPQLIKKAYKLIPRLATTESGTLALKERSSELQNLLISTTDKTPPPARRDRLLAIHEVITYLPSSDLHFIPSILSEIVLGCKETNEKARSAAFGLLIHLAERVADPERNPPGTKIRNSLAPHMPDDAPDASATIEEFFTMVSAGLAGSSPHMVAASITALSRLLFEYHSKLSSNVSTDLVQTIDLFLTSNNREIVRSVLGFVKVVVVVLPDDQLRLRLTSLVPNLMVWSKEHKGRLRSKVKGILDRLIRRFGSTVVEGLVGDADRKLVVAIRKDRERRKRKKKEGQAGEDDEEDEEEARTLPTTNKNNAAGPAAAAGEKSFSNEFDKAVYGSDFSDSDLESDDASEIDVDEQGNMHTRSSGGANKGGKGKNNKPSGATTGKGGGRGDSQYIREMSPESNPLDLLAPDALASISTTKPSVRFLASKEKKRSARVDADGKLILGLDDAGDNDVSMGGNDAGAGINAYLDAVSGPDAAKRGQKGRLKVGQGGSVGKKRGGLDEDGNEEMDVDDDNENDKGGNDGAGVKKGGSGRRGLGIPKTKGSTSTGGGAGGGAGRIQKKAKAGRGAKFARGNRSGSGFRTGGRR